ncbi:pyridoxal-phosphate dependent enzyme domain-containing protein [Hirsutella rhossiliensis]|uniref:Pyridoxal-phosphate dependent enzyme domain-containing protein n=1 Tax=Hirsutella rhossiliensis TaxID=111463 RepID=A0A9P8MNL5_9HYPO|nr:pyridoxal-phosphate dependent enzyme domain-containing protein [Hirsutella rhossiliensis]KAH0959503.1 pyridoxal-phosphate dependent enzyme domain-containing protein [Hirsutella rhossiliensis]
MAHPSTCPPLTRESVLEAHRLVAPHVHRTPVVTCRTLSELASRPRSPADLAGTPWAGRTPARPRFRLWFKCENLQRVGAFKVRGAFHALLRLMREEGWLEGGGRSNGVVTHSSGNHAQALALAAKELGLPAHVVMPSISATPKIAATKDYGANVVFSGSTSEEREAVTARVMADTGARLVPPYDHPDIILGQGTMGLELQDQGTDGLDAIMTPCGGGGMLSGVGLSCEGTGILVFGAEPSFQGADDGRRGYYSHQRVEAVSSLTIADGLRTPVGHHPWAIIHDRGLVSGMFSVSEAEILAAMRLLFERAKLFVEPSACVGLAVALFNEDFRATVEQSAGDRGWDLGLVLSGGNVGLDALSAMFAEELRP